MDAEQITERIKVLAEALKYPVTKKVDDALAEALLETLKLIKE